MAAAGNGKLMAEWFWIDRWVGSSAFSLPLEARGLYREMLTQAWRRKARLPNDHEQIRRMTGVTRREWNRAWPNVERYWRVDGDSLVNDTQVDVYTEAADRSRVNSERGRKGARARYSPPAKPAQADPEHCLSTAQAQPEHCSSTTQAVLEQWPPSPSPSPVSTKASTTSTAAPPPLAFVSPLSREPSEDGNYRVILKLAHDVIEVTGLREPTDPDLVEALKAACARHKIDYSAFHVISRALESAGRVRTVRAGPAAMAKVSDLRLPEELTDKLRAMTAQAARS